jgi:hypothetical protein
MARYAVAEQLLGRLPGHQAEKVRTGMDIIGSAALSGTDPNLVEGSSERVPSLTRGRSW